MLAKDKALQLRAQGFNCAQCVLAAFGEKTGLDENTALAVSGGFGGGVRCGEICGALSGAVMALGLTAPYKDGADTEARNRIAKLTMAMDKGFAQQFGCLRCQDLKRSGIPCNELIAWAAEAAEKMIEDSN